ncbi:MAG TPA: lysophospholipid acyltransferase family protein [Mycobacteriales bacterium]|jgi:1-acyl-sn-glycerol-3-phosphate acyltransferase|nr:lysophospholipid acyltransferase family protein [Mycobacteriales bacterium]
MAEVVYPPVIAVARGLFAALGLRFTITGTENIPKTGGAVMAINHVGYLDFTFAGLAARPAKRLVRFMAKEEVFRHGVAGPLMRGMKHIPVDREAGSASFRAALTALKSGEIVGVFPEATISQSFEIKDFKSGAVRMARSAGVPILPTIVWGSQRVWTKGRSRRFGYHRTPVHIAVGEPITVPPKADPDAVSAELRERMSALLHEVQAAYPDQPRGEDDRWWLPARLGGTAPTPEEAAALDAAEAEERRARRAARLAAREQAAAPSAAEEQAGDLGGKPGH